MGDIWSASLQAIWQTLHCGVVIAPIKQNF
jgi:hypothetical protein